jgi:hypothetical protein
VPPPPHCCRPTDPPCPHEIPEPGTIALAAIGLGGMAAAAAKKGLKKKPAAE